MAGLKGVLIAIAFSFLCPFSHAESLQAQQASELNNTGVTVAKDGDFESGVSFLRRALELNPADGKIRTNLSGMLTDWARALAGQNKTEQASAAYRDAFGQEAAP